MCILSQSWHLFKTSDLCKTFSIYSIVIGDTFIKWVSFVVKLLKKTSNFYHIWKPFPQAKTNKCSFPFQLKYFKPYQIFKIPFEIFSLMTKVEKWTFSIFSFWWALFSLKKLVVLKKTDLFEVGQQVIYLELVYLVTALVPSETACLASSPGRRRRTAVWISREVMVDLLL